MAAKGCEMNVVSRVGQSPNVLQIKVSTLGLMCAILKDRQPESKLATPLPAA
jgi:hypothetical protein